MAILILSQILLFQLFKSEHRRCARGGACMFHIPVDFDCGNYGIKSCCRTHEHKENQSKEQTGSALSVKYLRIIH